MDLWDGSIDFVVPAPCLLPFADAHARARAQLYHTCCVKQWA